MNDLVKKYTLGLDTSNYTTSVALIDKDFNIVEDRRRAIKVKEGMRGIRQSEALFQHMNNLPDLLKEVLHKYGTNLAAVCASSRPRPVEGSYMPVFNAGMNYGRVISDSLSIPFLVTSHQEGHIEAGLYDDTDIWDPTSHLADLGEELAVFHLSGGTTEILLKNEILGGSKDISFGQLLDRVGVGGGLAFPAGKELDRLACKALDNAGSYTKLKERTLEDFKYISKDGLKINLSGIESQIKRMMDEGTDNLKVLSGSILYLISHCLKALTMDLQKQYNVSSVLFVGGVSESNFIRDYLANEFQQNEMSIYFAKSGLSVDNAVGVAIIGGKSQWL